MRRTASGSLLGGDADAAGQSGGSGQYAKIKMTYEPNTGEGFEFSDEIIAAAVPKEFIPAVMKGTENELLNGIQAGFPAVDVKARLTDDRSTRWTPPTLLSRSLHAPLGARPPRTRLQ